MLLQQLLTIVDEVQLIRRHSCMACGAHLFGGSVDINHHFHGLCFVHPELATSGSCGAPEFADFFSSLVESGTSPSLMETIDCKLRGSGKVWRPNGELEQQHCR